jgi:predicted DNA-binding transcriptional regulator AlpA
MTDEDRTMAPVLSEDQAAELLGLSVRTLQRFRVDGCGPRYLKLGRKRVAYSEADISAWLEECRRQSTSER